MRLRAPALLLLLAAASAAAQAPRNQIQLHLSWTEADPSRHVTVMWWSALPYTPTVQLGTTSSYGSSQSGTSTSLSVEPGTGNVHMVKLTGLEPSTTYHYRVGNGTDSWSDDFTFTTGPTPGDPGPVTFVAVGDMGTSTNARNNVSRMLALAPAFVLHTGDLSYATTSTGWNTWFNLIEPLAATRPYMVAVGNHDDDDNYAWYRRRFSLGGTDGRWYAFRYGPIHIVALDANTPSNADQLTFLRSEVDASLGDPKVRWRVAFFHQPAYSSNLTHGSSASVRARFTPELDRGGFDLVLQGHDHAYERTTPVRFDAEVRGGTGPDYVDPGAPIYLVTGGGGASLYTAFNPQPWTAFAEATFHFVRVVVEGNRLSAEAIRTSDGAVFDRFSITKTAIAVGDGGATDGGSGDGGLAPDAGMGQDGGSIVGPGGGGVPAGASRCGCAAAAGGTGLDGAILWAIALGWRRKRWLRSDRT